MFLGDDRKAFLEYLRNLTPQIFFFSLTIGMGSRLGSTDYQWNSNSWILASSTLAFFGIFLGSMIANATLFIETVFAPRKEFSRQVALVWNSDGKLLLRLLRTVRAAWIQQNRLLLTLFVAAPIMQFALYGVLATAIIHSRAFKVV
ncbi:hypothetical protein [Pigmentiphaga litoralis]|uniref:Uncharacterized protein n=1 Tax=Pigmentiphaga litoralis TaxID=516702 RepID=A0A7Y9IVQ9_9BURK|nr:hypothetical protein [Pigmentiphaga litoralis]NYE22992.1 hypothetical protein [Pigmentiphaga litoralis]NYE83393.1 hypothetical protein [Pigmentiphaga litoralis]